MTPAQKSYFENHPKTAELHFTSDGLPFFHKTDAEAHANGLEDKAVTTVQRHNAVQEDETPGVPIETKAQKVAREKKEAADKAAAEKAAADKEAADKAAADKEAADKAAADKAAADEEAAKKKAAKK